MEKNMALRIANSFSFDKVVINYHPTPVLIPRYEIQFCQQDDARILFYGFF